MQPCGDATDQPGTPCNHLNNQQPLGRFPPITWSMTRACPGLLDVQRTRIVVPELNTGATIVRAHQRAAGFWEKGAFRASAG
ncbi:hypothetical protein GCM10027570_21110 [Streptomonospora sediminis]